MGPTGFLGLNAALKQRWAMKHASLRPLMSQSLLKMLILSGLNEAVAETDATPRDLKTVKRLSSSSLSVTSHSPENTRCSVPTRCSVLTHQSCTTLPYAPIEMSGSKSSFKSL